MNNNGDGKIPMIGQEKRDKWKKILPELLAVILCLVLMGAGVSRKEGYHMDELLSFELANAGIILDRTYPPEGVWPNSWTRRSRGTVRERLWRI